MTIDEFVSRYFSLQQTALVDNMLYEDKHMDMLNSLNNLHMHTVELSSGMFIGTHSQLMAKKTNVYSQLQSRKSAALKRDIDLLETAQGTVRAVYEWCPVPYWIAKHMIDSDEVVLSWRDCYWWGRCAVSTAVTADKSVRKLLEQLGASP